MVYQILDSKSYKDGKSWYLCKARLYDFLRALHNDFYEYQIQRRIVRNVYLDGLYATIKKNSPIPPITLTTSGEFLTQDNGVLNIDMEKGTVDILDGLQRTFRLWIYLNLLDKIEANNIREYSEMLEYLKNKDVDGSYILSLDFINAAYLKSLFDTREVAERVKAYKEYDMYFTIWTNLSDSEIINKMLVLNAGQRPVSSTHQYELLFLHYFDHKKIGVPNVRLLREKDSDYFHVKRGVRKVGEYTMASMIIAMQSHIEKEPLRIAPANYIEYNSVSTLWENGVETYFSADNINQFISVVYRIDDELAKKDERFVKWFGKDTTMSGIFAAVGKCNISPQELLERIQANAIDFRLGDFNNEYDALASTKVNVGNVVRKAIFSYCYEELSGRKGDWKMAFKNDKNETF